MPPSVPHGRLPPPSPEEVEHADRVAAMLRERIAAAGGVVDFETFMELALYAPGLGYYSAGAHKLGPGGDFVTAPELSDLFSQCVARQCAQILEQLPDGEIVEFGAGTGRMAQIVLTELASLGVLPRRYRILEVSADLAARQRARLSALPHAQLERVSWLQAWPAEPIRGVLLANEVLDALPFQRFVMRAHGVHALAVGLDARGSLVELEVAAGAPLAAEFARLQRELPHALPSGYRSELCLRVAPWIRGLSQSLERGVALLFDYGLPRAHYYHPQRGAGTLRCHYRHHAHEQFLWYPGLCDITAWVDFTRVAEAAVESGLAVLGFVTQGAFLLGTGIEQRVAAAADLSARVRLAGEARRLLLPEEMGESFKLMALGRAFDAPLRGCAHQDLRRML